MPIGRHPAAETFAKRRMLVTVALANKMARIAWALLRSEEDYRTPAPALA
jgi:hypothetical protein